MKTHAFNGRIFDKATNSGIGELRVEGFAIGRLELGPLVSAATNSAGEFRVELTDVAAADIFEGRTPEIFFRVSSANNVVASTERTLRWRPTEDARGTIAVDVTTPLGTIVPARVRTVEGTLSLAGPITLTSGKTVRVFARELTSGGAVETSQLGLDAETDARGRYHVTYESGLGEPHDLLVQAFDTPVAGEPIAENTLCHAPARAVVDLIEGGSDGERFSGPPLFERTDALVRAVTGLSDTPLLAIEDEEAREILACRAGVPRADLDALLDATVLNDTYTDIPVDAIFAILRRGASVASFFHYPLAHMRAILEEAASSRTVGPRDSTALDTVLDQIETAAFDALSIPGTTGLPVGQLAAITPDLTIPGARNTFISLVLRNEGSAEEFWADVADELPDDVEALRFSADVARLSGFWPGTIIELHARRAPGGTARDLADYTPADWTDVVAESGFPPGTTAEAYALQLADQVDKRFRTAFLAGKYKAQPGSSLLKTFFLANPSIDFRTKRARRFFEDDAAFGSMTDLEIKDVKSDLLAYERLQMLTNSYAESEVLFANGLTSASLIHAKGKGALMAPPFNLSAPSSEAIYSKACWTTAAAVAVHAKYSPKYNMTSAMVLPNKAVSLESPAFEAAMPDWEDLFGTLDQCACEHCKSVLSPSAYLVDVVNLLDNFGSPTAKSVLFERRPDLQKLVLSCKNTETVLPYVDLVNEILEVKVATPTWPATPTRVESVGDSPQLQAHPELAYPEEHFQAYVDLAEAVHPFSSPFDLWIEEARVYLEHLGVSWHMLIEKLAVTAGAPDAPLLAMERLGLSPKQYDIVAGIVSPPAWELWGYASDPGSLTTALSDVPNLLKRGGVTYEELRELLFARIGSAGFPSNAPCTLEGLTLTGVDPTFFDNVQRLVRLQRRLGWSLTDLSKSLSAFEGAWSARAEALGGVARLRARTGLDPVELFAWYGKLDTQASEGAPSLFEALFLNRFVLNPDQEAFADVFVGSVGAAIANYAAAIQSGLQISAADFRLLTDADTAESEMLLLPAVPGTALLSLADLSRLFRIASCARALRLSVRELLTLRELAGDTVLTGDNGSIATPDETLAFFEKVDKARATGFTPDELSYLLRHVAPAASGLEPGDAVRSQWDAEILAGVKAAANEALQIEDQTGALLESLAGQLLIPTDLTLLKNIAEKSLSKDAANSFLAGVFAPYLDKVVAAQDALVGGTGSGTVAGTITGIEERRAYLAQQLQRYTSTAAFVKNWTAKNFGLEQAAADRLLTSGAITRDELSSIPALFAFLPGAVWDQSAETDPSKRAAILVRLQKAALLVKRLQLSAAELDLLYPDGGGAAIGGLPQLALRTLPVARPLAVGVAAGASLGFDTLIALCDYAGVRSAFRGADALLEVFDLAGTEPLDVVLDAVALATGWSRRDIERLATRFGYTTSASFRNQTGLARMLDVVPLLQRIGASAAQAIAWETDRETLPTPATPETSPSAYLVARDIKRLAKSKHTEAAWAEIARPLRNVLRDRQREALVDRLVGVTKTKEELFHELLIDIEMSPCQLTSRMVLAHGTVQLFMGQILMGLAGDLEPNADIAREWRWMKNYRVWEANRKVFLWPENWIEPELRDNKTPLFKELETKLLQGTLDEERAEDAFRGYLDGLSDISNLEIMALHDAAAPPSPHFAADTTPTLHVFGKSRRNKKYYHRSRHDGTWSPWQKLDFDIDSQHLIPISLAGKLYLFWPQFSERLLPKEQSAEEQASETGVRFSFSELRSSGWTAPSTCPDNPLFVGHAVAEKAFSFNAGADEAAIKIACRIDRSQVPELGIAEYDGTLVVAGELTFHPGTRRASLRGFDEWDANSGPIFVIPNAPEQSAPSAQAFERPGVSPSFSIRFSPDGSAGEPPLKKLFQTGISAFSVMTDRLREPLGEGFKERKHMVYHDDRRAFLLELDRAYTHADSPVPYADYLLNPYTQRYRAELFYHPYVGLFQQQLALRGVDGLLRWADQDSPIQLETDDISSFYLPKSANVGTLPLESINFDSSPFGEYNWEIFFHAPFLIATRLMQAGRHAEAQKWLHYIFDPTDGNASLAIGPRQYWKVKPLYNNKDLANIQLELLSSAETAEAQQLDALNAQAQTPASDDLVAQIEIFRQDPFDPHAIARLRPVAYQKAIVIRYIENLIAWGDQLFAQDTIESVNEATQLYILASQVLGTKPTIIREPNEHETKTLGDLDHVDAFSNQLTEVETFTPVKNVVPGICGVHPPVPTLVTGTLYFCVPPNEKLFGLWDLVADRLFKIRHCMNLEGIVRTLPLFQPPIDPALLVRATAAGIDIASVLYDLNTAAPPYRYSVLYGKAQEFAQGVISLGGALLSAMEKQDGEHVANLRSQHEIAMQSAIREVRKSQLAEAKESLKGLTHARAQAQLRLDFYSSRTLTNADEESALEQLRTGQNYQNIANGLQLEAQIAQAFGNVQAGIAAAVVTGGQFVGDALQAGAGAAQFLGAEASFKGSTMSTMAGYGRRLDDWKLQASVAKREIQQLDSQILAAEIRVAVAERERDVVELQITQSREADSFMRSKFTSEDLYGWMVGQLRAVYFQAYQLAYDMAKRAQSAFQYERGDKNQTFINFGYWDGQKNGLLAGEKLAHDLRRMDAAYVTQNKRELELTKSVSLAEHAPMELVKLRDGNPASFSFTEDDYDRDFASHYLRRFRSIAVTVPCTSGPYQGVLGTLSLLQGATRRTAAATELDQMTGVVQSIVTSHAQADAGMFELVFRDDRLLPFEGVGAHVTSSSTTPQLEFSLSRGNRFNYETIDDLVLDIRYTARPGAARARPASQTYQRLIRIRDEFPLEWATFKTGDSDSLALELPFDSWNRARNEAVTGSTPLVAGVPKLEAWFDADQSVASGTIATLVGPGSGTPPSWNLSGPTAGVKRASLSGGSASAPPGTWQLTFQAAFTAGQRASLTDLWLILDYTVSVLNPS